MRRMLLMSIALVLAATAAAAGAGSTPATRVAGDVATAGTCPDGAIVRRADRPVIGLVLSGGGARGAAHVGVLRAIEAAGIPVDLVVGTSMGSFVGGLYASGKPVDAIDALVRNTDWPRVLDDAPPRGYLSLARKQEDRAFGVGGRIGIGAEGVRLPAGVSEGQNARLMLRRELRAVAGIDCFAQLPLPFAAIATDAESGEQVVLDHGDLVDALRASMAIPGYFSPVLQDGRLLVDGGVANNMPVSLARAMGADIVIAVDIATPPLEKAKMRNVLDIALQMSTLLATRGSAIERASLTKKDVLIVPDLGDIGTLDFPRMPAAIAAGEQAARAQLGAFPWRDRQAAIGRPAAQRQPGTAAGTAPATLATVSVGGDSGVPDQQIIDRFGLVPGSTLSDGKLTAAIQRVYGLDYFSLVDYRRTDGSAGTAIEILPTRRDWGPNYLKFGLSLYDNFEGINQFGLGASYTATALNRFTGQLHAAAQVGDTRRLHLELYQPATQRGHFFAAPWLDLDRHHFDLFAGNDPVARYNSSTDEAGFDIGLAYRSTEWRLGYAGGRRRLDNQMGPALLPDATLITGYLRALGNVDTFDDGEFPSRGGLVRILVEQGNASLGSSGDFTRYRFVVDHAYGREHMTVDAGLTVLSHDNGTGVTLEPAQLGGILRMSAFTPGELAGEHAAAMHVTALRRVNTLDWLRLYAGGALEWGAAWNGAFSDLDRQQAWPVATALLGLDTPLGPVYLSAGISENHRQAVQFQLGSRF